jgi:hypothetical protein
VNLRYNPPPGWPAVPEGFAPEPGWQPDPSWPPLPPGWQLWVSDDESVVPGSLPSYPSVARSGAYHDPRAVTATSGLAIASLVLGILGGAVLAAIFGIVALGKIRDTGQKGRGLAIAGIILSCVWVVVAVAAVVTSHGHAKGASNAQVGTNVSQSAAASSSGVVNVHGLAVGNCFTASPTQPVTSVTLIPCREAHGEQVFAVWEVAGSSYPGNLYQVAGQGCEERRASLTASASSLEISDLHPGQASWAEGDRVVYCLIISPAADLTSSLLNGKAGANVIQADGASSSGVVSVHALAVGNCFTASPTQPVTWVTLIPCREAHGVQVFAVWEVAGSSYPGNLYQVAGQGCQARRASLTASASSLEVSDFFPGQASWADGDRVVYCLIISPAPNLNSSLLAS